MRVTTAFNKMLGIPGATVAEVSFTPEGVVARLRRRSRVKMNSSGPELDDPFYAAGSSTTL